MRPFRIALALAIVLSSSPALAQPTEEDKSLALTLFRRGRELMEAKRIDEACASFAESQRLDPGGGTLLNLAVCHEEQGRTASAWAEFSDGLALARRDQRPDRIELAQTHLSALEPKLSRLVINAPSDVALRIVRNGSDVPSAAVGVAVPVDPGHHVVEAFVGPTSVFRAEIDVGPDGDRRVVEIVPSEIPPEPPSQTSPPLATTMQAEPPPRRSSLRPILGWSLASAGAISMGAGTFFGIRALDEQSASDDGCRNGRCSSDAVDHNDSAKKLADVSTATITLGALAVAVGVALILFDH